MKASDYIVSVLEKKGIEIVFGYIGGMITHLVDSIDKNDKVRYIQTYHEQTAAIAAEGYALGSGKFGVAISTSGPGLTNMITGIADAYYDSIPVIYISGQVNTYEYKYDKPIRQLGFQEIDAVRIAESVTKYAVLVDKVENLRYELEKAIHIATSGRKGPVLLDIPMNIQRAEANFETMTSFVPADKLAMTAIPKEAFVALQKAKRPMVLVGGGCQDLKTAQMVNQFLSRSQIPVVTSLKGRGAIDETYVNYMGMIGCYGNRYSNMGMAQADVLLILGSRLDTRQTGAKIEAFLPNATMIHVDIDSAELEHHRLKNRIQIHAEVCSFLSSLENLTYQDYTSWTDFLKNLKEKYRQDNEVARFVANKSPYEFFKAFNQITKENEVITTDIGQNQMWAAQSVILKKGQKYITSGGLASMGFSIPVAIGMSLAQPNQTIYCITGDGSFHMALQSLMLISQYNLPIKVIVLNNAALGMITQFQHLYFEDRLAGTTAQGGYEVPDMEVLAKAFNMPYFKLNSDIIKGDKAFSEIIKTRYALVEYKIEGLTTVSPKLEYNQPIYRQTPLLDNQELASCFLNSQY